MVSLNGKKTPSYILEYNDTVYYPYPIFESDSEKSLINLKLKNLKPKVNSNMQIYYGVDEESVDFYFIITIDKITDNKTNKINNNFEVLSGIVYGILDSENIFDIETILSCKYDLKYLKKSKIEYLEKKFIVEENNNKIKEYIEEKQEKSKNITY